MRSLGRIRHIHKYLLFVALTVSCCAMTGCVESAFNLASESRLPRSVKLPPGLTRTDVSVELRYYTSPLGGSANFLLRDKKGKKLANVHGKTKGRYPLHLRNPQQGSDSRYRYPSYEVITANGITEIIEHRKMEPMFYVSDDPAVWKELVGVQPQNP